MFVPAHLGGGALEPLQLIVLLAMGFGYARRALTLAERGQPVSTARFVSFALGLGLITVALLSPLEHVSEELVLAHMAQHLLIGDVGALLIVLGLTGPLLQPLLAVRGLRWMRTLAHPAVAFPIWVASLYLWHIPALYQAATFDGGWIHALEHSFFIGAGLAMWMALLGPLPKPAWFGNGARAGYVVAIRLAGAVLANVMMWSGSVLYPRYGPGESGWSVTPLADQGTAGTIMMLEGTVVTIACFAWLLQRWAREDAERQSLLDLATERGVELDPARAARAAAAGEAARLRERIEAGPSA